MADYLCEQFGLAGRRALVTGGSRGIGAAIAQGLGAAGAEVLVHYRSREDAATEVANRIRSAGGSADTVQADLGRKPDVDRVFDQVRERWDAMDILINNAGDVIARSTLADADDEYIDRVLRVNLWSTLYCCRAAVSLLRNGRDPAIVNLTSISARNGGQGGVSIYAAAKGGTMSVTRSLARELGPEIRVNAIAPGVIMTDIHRTLSTEELLAQIATRTPLARNGEPEECAGVVVFLCSRASSFITGEVIDVNGGLWMA